MVCDSRRRGRPRGGHPSSHQDHRAPRHSQQPRCTFPWHEPNMELPMTKPATTVTTTENEPAISIPKPPAFDLSAMVAKEPVSSIQRMEMALPIKRLSDVGDFARLHPDDRTPEEGVYWTERLCFVDVPVKGSSKRV